MTPVTTTREPPMARKTSRPTLKPVGPTILMNLLRLGYADIVPRSTELARLVAEKTDRTISRQRISAITNSVSVEPETIELLATAIGVDPEELQR